MAGRFKNWLNGFKRSGNPDKPFKWDETKKEFTLAVKAENIGEAYQLKGKIENFLKARSFVDNIDRWNNELEIELVWGLIHHNIQNNKRKLIRVARYELNIPDDISDRDVFEVVMKNKQQFGGHPYFKALDTREVLQRNQKAMKNLIIRELGESEDFNFKV